MKTTLKEYLNEATVEKDKYYYDIAIDFFDKMIVELNQKNYINQTDGNIIFKASEINPEYYNLLIMFIDYNSTKTKAPFADKSGGYGFGTYKQYKVITITNLKDDKNPAKNINKDSFIHEFIHYLDFKRSGYKPKFNDKTTKLEYYNSDTEYNAYYQEAANYIVDLLKNEDTQKRFKEKFKSFIEFYDWMLDSVFDKTFISFLNDKYKNKLQKRVYNIYDKYLK